MFQLFFLLHNNNNLDFFCLILFYRAHFSTNAITKTIQVYNGGLDPEKLSMYDDMEEVDQESILSAYSLDNIK